MTNNLKLINEVGATCPLTHNKENKCDAHTSEIVDVVFIEKIKNERKCLPHA